MTLKRLLFTCRSTFTCHTQSISCKCTKGYSVSMFMMMMEAFSDTWCWYDLSDWNESDIEIWDSCLIWERCRDEGTFCDLDLLEVDGGDSPLLGRGLGLGRSARDSGALELSEACSLFESVLKAESSKDELSNDTKTQIHADKLNKITITKTQSTDNLSLFCCCFFFLNILYLKIYR